MNVLIVCAAGMSSSVLVNNLRDLAKERNDSHIKIGSCSSNQIDRYIQEADLVLLSPQLIYLFEFLIKEHPHKAIKNIPIEYYGMHNQEDFYEIYKLISTDGNSTQSKTWLGQSRWGKALINISFEVSSNNIVQSINDGMLSLLPITLIGSIFLFIQLLLINLSTNVDYITFIINLLQIGIDGTTNLISVYLTYFITFHYAKRINLYPITAAVNSLVCFFLLVSNSSHRHFLSSRFLGVEGIFTAIIVSIFSTALLKKILFLTTQKKFNLKYIQSSIVFESLRSIIPIFVSVSVSFLFASIFFFTDYKTFPQWIYSTIDRSISDIVSNNIISELALSVIANFLWFVGIHGGNIINSIRIPIYTAFSFQNMMALATGKSLVNIINHRFTYMYVIGGAGSTFGLVLLMIFFAKSQRFKNIGKVSLPLGIFFINETVIFGVPIVFNLLMLIPFLLITPLLGFVTYFAMKIHLIPYAAGYDIPWITPFIISGFIQGGWKLAFWQILMLFSSMLLWYPFFKIQDERYLLEEKDSLF